MEDFLSNFKFWQLFLVALVGSVLVIFVLLKAISSGSSVSLPGGIKIGGKGKEGNHTHGKCPKALDFILVVEKTTEIVTKRTQIIYYRIVGEQMKYAEEKLNVIKGI